jgi:site-specific DNA-cytosine methylase
VEATDGIIDRLVGDMIDKIGSLVQRALENSNGTANLGSEKCPLKLGTACSGTDAPALALTLVNEQMRLRKLGTDHNKLFFNEHVFSCENEAFKSAYLARNFDSTLYPDIAHLCDNPPLDVYGRPQAIGDFNLFVAGTSCKNFSMLRSNKRIDIEDKGCSGETFIAAIELLFKEKPRYAIFENVIGAPWEKMSEYITGRIKLSSSSSSKAIKDIKTAEKSKDLTFVLEDGNIIVDYVPGYFGVRCGSIVKGFVKGNTNTIQKVTFPTKNNNNTCSLTALMKSNGILREKDTMVFETGVTYSTRHMKVDTKRFGLPQTRARVYMFVWQPEKEGNINDDLGDYWEAIVRHLESPVRHSLESFVLQPDHDIIRVFREALNGPSGRTSKRETFLEPDFW